jgi:hypothetical protein
MGKPQLLILNPPRSQIPLPYPSLPCFGASLPLCVFFFSRNEWVVGVSYSTRFEIMLDLIGLVAAVGAGAAQVRLSFTVHGVFDQPFCLSQ